MTAAQIFHTFAPGGPLRANLDANPLRGSGLFELRHAHGDPAGGWQPQWSQDGLWVAGDRPGSRPPVAPIGAAAVYPAIYGSGAQQLWARSLSAGAVAAADPFYCTITGADEDPNANYCWPNDPLWVDEGVFFRRRTFIGGAEWLACLNGQYTITGGLGAQTLSFFVEPNANMYTATQLNVHPAGFTPPNAVLLEVDLPDGATNAQLLVWLYARNGQKPRDLTTGLVVSRQQWWIAVLIGDGTNALLARAQLKDPGFDYDQEAAHMAIRFTITPRNPGASVSRVEFWNFASWMRG